MAKQASILIIYTGGTIGMVRVGKKGLLRSFDFASLLKHVPELQKIEARIKAVSFEKPMDSSNMEPDTWKKLAAIIGKHYPKYDGFVVLHGSDTMAYTAFALSFMLQDLSKPVVLTGSQLPIGILRTDGKENFVTAVEIAAAQKNGRPVVSEVCIYFEYKLYRGNRSHKYNAEQFNAFQSPNYPELAEAGVKLRFNEQALMPFKKGKLELRSEMDPSVAILKLFPGIQPAVVSAVMNAKGLKAVILETFGAGNASTDPRFLEAIRRAVKSGIYVLNITQCNAGAVEQGKYETSIQLMKAGVISGGDMTTEAAVTKVMWLLGQKHSPKAIKKMLTESLRGELTE